VANFWDLVTGASTLTVQPGTNFWDHSNALGGGSGSFIASELEIVMGEIDVEIVEPLEVELLDAISVEIIEPLEVEIN